MFCQKCGFQNEGTSRFCVKCGNEIGVLSEPVTPELPVQNQNSEPQVVTGNNFGGVTNEFVNQAQPSVNPTTNEFVNNEQSQPQPMQNHSSDSKGSLNYLFFILAVLLKPVTSIKEELNKFEDTKTSVIFAGLIAGVTTIISLIKTIFSVVYIPASSGYFGYGATEAEWVWENLKNLKWGEVIFKNFLLYAGVLLAIALVYYLASLIIKKNASFKRLLGIASISVIPLILCSLVISPLIAKIYSPLGVIVTVVGAVYTLILLLDGINREMAFEDNDAKIYINLVCLSILGCVGYYVFMKLVFTGSGLGDLNNLLDLFN